MITKSDWQAANRQLMTDDRRRVGEPPTAEEMLAYTRGELSAEEEARVQQRLACHPELVRTLTETFPIEGAEPGDPDYMADEEFAAHWASLQKRMSSPAGGGPVLQFWRSTAAIAAVLAVAFAAMFWQTNRKAVEPRIVWEQQVLFPDGRRGPENATLFAPQGESVLLVIPLIGQREYQRYRFEIIDVASHRVIWSSGALAPRDDQTFAILVPRRFLKPGLYQVAAYGLTGAAEEPLATYSLRVAAGRS